MNVRFLRRILSQLAVFGLALSLVDCGGGGGGGGSTTPPVPTMYTVTANVGAGTTATPATQQVTSGQPATLSVGLLVGYSNLVVTGGGGTLTGTTYTTGPITANTTITTNATAIPAFTVSVMLGTGTSATPVTQQVPSGQSAVITVGLMPGYTNLVVTGGGGTLNGSTYTTGPITANTTINTSATALPAYTVSVTAGTGTTAAPMTQQVFPGQRASISVGLLSGFTNLVVTGGGGTLSSSTYTTGPITADTVIAVSATPQTFTVTAVAGPGTTISPASRTVLTGLKFHMDFGAGCSNGVGLDYFLIAQCRH